MQPLPTPEAFLGTQATAVSSDGLVTVGRGAGCVMLEPYVYSWCERPLRWSPSGVEELTPPPGSYGSETPTDVSADGTFVVADAYWDDGRVGVRWDAGGAPQFVGGLLWSGEIGGPAHAVSADGTIVFGETDLHIGQGVYRWTEQTGALTLDISGRPVAASADGTVLVGNQLSQDSEVSGIFIWREGVVPPVDPPISSLPYGISIECHEVKP